MAARARRHRSRDHDARDRGIRGRHVGASCLHINIFGLNPVLVHGTGEQKRRMLPPMVQGKEKACFAVIEPNTGLNTTQLKTRAVRKGDRYVVDGQKVWISTAQVADEILLLARHAG